MSSLQQGGIELSHAAFYVDNYGNYGDELLPVAVRESVSHLRPVGGWSGYHVHQVFDDECVEQVNATQGLLVGGGGLFLPDTSPNGNSGWQWNVPRSSLDRLKVPLGLIAVGYNLFDGQTIAGDLFRESVIATVDRADFVGLRNHGSIERVRELLPESLREKVTYLPCPTTILGCLPDSGFEDVPGPVRSAHEKPLVYLNVAYDRASLRFKEGYGDFVAAINRFIGTLGDRAEVRVAAHTIPDEQIAVDLYREYGTRIGVDSFNRDGIAGATKHYREASLVIGMRGHAGMIPFGLGTPILSLVSHPKLQYFLDDVGHPEWGVRVDSPNLSTELLELTESVLDDETGARKAVTAARDGLYRTFTSNLKPFLASL